MNTPSLSRELEVAIAAVTHASRLCSQVQSQISTDALEKKDRSPVTIADYCSQAIICKQIKTAFNDDEIVGEEEATDLKSPENEVFLKAIERELSGEMASTDEMLDWINSANANGGSGRFWTVDPIDGTKGFLRKDQYAVALALLDGGQPILGLLGCPNLMAPDGTKGLLFAATGDSAWQAPLSDTSQRQPVKVSDQTDITATRLCESFESSHSKHDTTAALTEKLGITASPVRMDSQAKYATVAAGGAEAYLRFPTSDTYREKIWDHAAGAFIVTQAGGKVTDMHGKELEWTHGQKLEQNRGLVVTNGHLHEQILAAIAATL